MRTGPGTGTRCGCAHERARCCGSRGQPGGRRRRADRAGPTVRGNPTVIQQLTTAGNLITTKTFHYNILGEIVEADDGNSNATKFDYTDSWNDSSCLSSQMFAYPTTITNALGQVTKTTYNSCDGTVHSVKDQNDINASRAGTITTYEGMQR